MQWFRLWHGFLQSPKWTLVAQRSGCSRGDVLNVALFLLDFSSRNGERGNFDGYDPDECEVLTGVTRNVTVVIVEEIGKLSRSPFEKMTWKNWGEFQPRDMTAAERMRRFREKKQASTETPEPQEQPVTRNATVVTTRTEQNRTEKKEESSASGDAGLTPAPRDAELAKAFETQFWPAYPRRKGKAAAKTKFITRAKHCGVAAIIGGLERAKAEWQRKGTEPDFIPHPATWLNQGRWDDEPDYPRLVANGARPMMPGEW